MRALVVYESMYGNTHAIGDAIGRGLARGGEVQVVAIARATPEMVAAADLLIVGGPTHMHGMAKLATREKARERAARTESTLVMDPDAGQIGVKELLRSLPRAHGRAAAAFDTRVIGPAWLTGHAATAIAGRLRRRGFHMVAPPESFLVDHETHLVDGEVERAEQFGTGLAGAFTGVG